MDAVARAAKVVILPLFAPNTFSRQLQSARSCLREVVCETLFEVFIIYSTCRGDTLLSSKHVTTTFRWHTSWALQKWDPRLDEWSFCASSLAMGHLIKTCIQTENNDWCWLLWSWKSGEDHDNAMIDEDNKRTIAMSVLIPTLAQNCSIQQHMTTPKSAFHVCPHTPLVPKAQRNEGFMFQAKKTTNWMLGVDKWFYCTFLWS